MQGNSRRNGQFYWNGDTDFYESGLVVDRDNNNYEDNFMTFSPPGLKPPTTGNYVFNINQKTTVIAIWLDLDQDGVFEGGSGTDGANPEMSFLIQMVEYQMNGNMDTVSLTAGQEYKMAIGHVEYGGGQGLTCSGTEARWKHGCDESNGFCYACGMFNITGTYQTVGFLRLKTQLGANATSLVKGNTYYYRIKWYKFSGY